MKNAGLVWSLAGLLVLSGSMSGLRAADTGVDPQDDQVSGHFGPAASAFAAPAADGGGGGSLPRFGLGVKVSVLLGIGIEAATSVTQKTNVRGGFNFFGYTLTGNTKGFDYSGNLHLRSADVMFDWFPFGGGFHLSPGALIYNDNKVTATVTVPPGTKLTLNNQDYFSSAANPITGTANVDLHNYKVAPMILFGWGNLLRRKGGHFSVNFEAGAAFTGQPNFALNLAGSACNAALTVCVPAATDPGVQANVKAQQATTNNDIKFLKAFPIISIGAGWRF